MTSDDLLAVIGTAGRQSDAVRINSRLYDAMYAALLRAMSDWAVVGLVSGGAAVADHLAVRAYLNGEAKRLVLHLPAPFDRTRKQYVRPRGAPSDDAGTANRYHAHFSRCCGIDSLNEVAEAIARGAEIHVGTGFKARNLDVANQATHMLALTFGADQEAVDLLPDHPAFVDSRSAGLKDGGTAHTWSQCWKARFKRHVSLNRLERDLTDTLAPSLAR